MSIVNDKPTPETDEQFKSFPAYFEIDLFCRKLERERDEAREDLEFRRGLYKVQEQHLETARRERDEAREELSDWENAALHVEADHPDEKHCGCVPVLRKLLTDARSERDEARELLASEKITRNHIIEKGVAIEKERDEAREIIAAALKALPVGHIPAHTSGSIADLCKTIVDAERERDHWKKIASAFEVLMPPVGGKRILKIIERDGWKCAYCGVETCFNGWDGPMPTVDHITPKAKGGLDHIANCVVACKDCNSAKSDQENWSPNIGEQKEKKTWAWEDGKFRKKTEK